VPPLPVALINTSLPAVILLPLCTVSLLTLSAWLLLLPTVALNLMASGLVAGGASVLPLAALAASRALACSALAR
jgi:hypothetical protein